MSSLQNEIQALAPWNYTICLPDDNSTLAAGHKDIIQEQWQDLKNILPGDLTGLMVLEIGCSNGFHAIELAKRGAKVLVIDPDPHYIRQAGWVVSQFHFQNRIWVANMHLYDLPQLNMQFDIVLCLGAFYALLYPRLALNIVCQKATGTVIFANPYTALKGIKAVLAASQFYIAQSSAGTIYVAERQADAQPDLNTRNQKRLRGRRRLKNRATQEDNSIK